MKNRFIGDVYIGGAETDSLHEIAVALSAMREKHPGVSLRYRSGDTSDLESRLDRGLIDFAIFVERRPYRREPGVYRIRPERRRDGVHRRTRPASQVRELVIVTSLGDLPPD